MKVFTVTKFGAVTAVEMGSAPVGKPFMTARIYLLDHILIDSGLSHCRKDVLALLGQNRVDSLYLTHHHEDHSGNAAVIKKRFSIPVFGHPITAEKLAVRFPIYPYQHYMWGASSPVEVLKMPATVETSRYSLIPVHAPGHSRDHTVYWEPQQGWLFSGDLYLADRIKYFRADEVLKDQIDSLERVLKLDFDALFCAHNPKPQQGKQYLKRKLDYFNSIFGQVADLWGKGMNSRQIMQEIGIKEGKLLKLLCSGNVKAENIVLSAIASLTATHPHPA
jgi:glyoxylase-like metal-dependent hydrolase (beta-lactamase superfamily II)